MYTQALLLDKYVRYLLIVAAMMLSVLIFSIVFFVGQQGLQTFTAVSLGEFFFGSKWDPSLGSYGALSFILGSLLVTAVSIVLATPLGVLGALFTAKVAPGWLRGLMKPAMDLYVAIPSVVYGYLGLIIVVPFVRSFFHVQTGFGIMSASIILSIMILPTIISLSTDAIRAVPKSLGEASLALGATEWQTMYRILIPAALPGILTSVVLAMARAIGETMAVQMLIGNTPLVPTSLFMPTSTLTSNIVVEMGNTLFGSTWSNALFLMALVLLILSLALILLIRSISKRSVQA